MNILIKKFKEIYINSGLKISGKWNISIMHPNGEEEFIFGKDMKKNLILDQGLDILAASKYYTEYNNRNWNTIPAFLFGGAVCGQGNSLSSSDTELSNFFKETFKVNDFSCQMVDDISNGTRTYKKIFDFPRSSPDEVNILIKEIGITTPWNKNPDGSQKIFSKFILPEAVRLMPEQWIRLYYDFIISCSDIIDPTPVNVVSEPTLNFNPNGQIMLAGRYADTYGDFDSNGFMRIKYGDSPRASFLPFWDEFCMIPNQNLEEDCNPTCLGAAYMIEDIYENIAINQQIISQWIGKRSTVKDSTIEASAYLNGNFYRDITYIFEKNNPNQDKYINAFLFTVSRSDRENTVDGWLWKFNNKQIKFTDKKFVIMLRQSVFRN